ncbi:hypothetical protein PTTG_25720 [Puccinia triticina 1-1 BBBD Race 1]|uniref:Uncharacterized protein n=1 Tax=Puccinia triticina (isolate 1-1 / race 1 (BBBD)) TaxID=630390 RepID=A0A180GZU1_PUCT1|nr:hypothetical protein PTTG_25720 [Puccinia triticina 1-1 BBBD Race 1]
MQHKISRSRSISPSEYEEWFHHPLTPPLERHVPGIFDGTAHLVKLRNRRREAFVQSQQRESILDPSLFGPVSLATDRSTKSTTNSQQSPLTNSQQSQHCPCSDSTSGRPEVPIGIDFILFVPCSPPPSPCNSCKQRSLIPNPPAYKKVVAEVGKLVVNWPTHHYDVDSFKAAAISSIRNNEDEEAGIFAEENKNDGKITWYLIIPHGGSFAAAQKKRLDSPEVFQQFIVAAEGTPEHCQIVCRLVQQDPSVVAQKETAYKHLKTARNGGASTSTTPADGPSQGAQSAASVAKLVNQLFMALRSTFLEVTKTTFTSIRRIPIDTFT